MISNIKFFELTIDTNYTTKLSMQYYWVSSTNGLKESLMVESSPCVPAKIIILK